VRTPAETYTGRVCRYDGTTERYVKGDNCKACKLKAAKDKRDRIREEMKKTDMSRYIKAQLSLRNWI
jgi:hypothetical protein